MTTESHEKRTSRPSTISTTESHAARAVPTRQETALIRTTEAAPPISRTAIESFEREHSLVLPADYKGASTGGVFFWDGYQHNRNHLYPVAASFGSFLDQLFTDKYSPAFSKKAVGQAIHSTEIDWRSHQGFEPKDRGLVRIDREDR